MHQSNLRIDPARLWDTLMDTAEIGKTPKGGICRLALTDLDRQVRDWLVAAAKDAGCEVRVDALGNIFAIRPGTDPSLAPIGFGSHLDTQPTGGKFDGILGVLAGLEVIRTLNDAGIETRYPVCLVDWTNEEGSRFAPAMIASGVYAELFDQEYADSRTDRDGTTMAGALEEIGYRGADPVGAMKLSAFVELHIEQGPILEAEDITIGVVTGAQGQMWYDVVITGEDRHAGTTPMPLRRDALMAMSALSLAIEGAAKDNGPDGVATIGFADIQPGSRNTVPGRVDISVDLRHPDSEALSAMDQAFRSAAAKIADERGVEIDITQIWDKPPVVFDADCVAAVAAAADACGYSRREIISGAGHDACQLNAVVPTGMVFVPCVDGISHNEVEAASREDCAAGANVLLQTVLSLMDR